MNRKRFKTEINDMFNKSNISKDNKNNIILIAHCKNKSVDLKHSFQTDLILNETKRNSSTNKKKNLKIKNNQIKIKNDIRNINLLSKNNSVSNLLNKKNKKKYFFDENFFKRKNSKRKLNISFKRLSNTNKLKHPISENIEIKNILVDTDNKNRNKRIVRIKKTNNIKESNPSNKNTKTEINNIKIHDILYENKMERNQKKTMNKSNLIYIKSKINKIPYRNKICSTSRASLSEKINNIKFNTGNQNNNHLIEDSLDTHNTIVDENNINEYRLFQQNLSYQGVNKLKNEEDKNSKNIIPRQQNMFEDSLNNKFHKKLSMNLMGRNKINKNYTPKTSRTNNEKYHSNYGMNLNNKFIYKKVHTQRLSATFNKNTNLFLTTSLTTTRNQTNKNKDVFDNIIINKDVTEFVYSDELFENCPNNKKINIKNWLSNSGLFSYYQNFYDKNIYDLNSLINDLKKIKNKDFLFNYVENNYQIHVPGHVFRILLKTEIEEGEIDSKITNFFIKREDSNSKLNKLQPSSLLQLIDNCDKVIDYSTINKNNLKLFLKKYHLIHLYHNFYQNGFDLINFVLLQMYSKNFSINDEILENCFHIYDQNDRNLVLNALTNEKNKINKFFNSKGYKKSINEFNMDNIGGINLNSFNYYNNFDIYFNVKETEGNGCKICLIF